MSLKHFIGLPLLFFIQVCAAQIHIGYYHDLEGLPVYDFIDPFQYSPKEKLSLSHYSNSYESGKIYFSNGKTAKGLIKYENKKIWFKKTESDEKLKIFPGETVGLTIGLDSFFVAKDFNVEKQMGAQVQDEPQFMQYLTSFDGKTYAKHYFFSSSSIIETYQVKNDGNSSWTSFPRNNKRFRSVAYTYFGHIPYLKQKLINESIGYKNMMTLIKSAEYYDKLKNDENLYFDKYWNETEKENSVFQAEIQSLENDSIWVIDYFKGASLLYRARYHSLFPNKKHGEFEMLSEEGETIHTIEYDKNDMMEKTVSFANGQPHYAYHFKEMSPGYHPYLQVDYKKIYGPSGELLQREGNWTEQVIWKQGSFTNEFSGQQLLKSFRIEDGLEIHQIIDPSYKFKTKKLQNLLDAYFEEIDFRRAAEKNVQGMYFITVRISDKGDITDFKVHNRLHPILDTNIRSWARKYFEGPYAIKFKPYKVGNEKVHAEFMIPLRFSIYKFYRKPASYYYDWNFYHQMMFQQQMMQPISLPNPPPMPGRF